MLIDVFAFTGIPTMIRSQTILLTLVTFAFIGRTPASAEPPTLVRFQVADQTLEGLRLVDVPQRLVILGRDGWLHDTIDSVRPKILSEVSGSFQAATAAEMRSELMAEFGREFEVVPTTHYLVVQPRGRGDRWPEAFESLHRQFIHYMSVRGIAVRSGRFPLVAVVLPDQVAMQMEFRRLGIGAARVAGVYHLASNRVIMHDHGHAGYVAETVRHETAHQAAYNVGVHSRVSDTPLWIVEGIGSLFEPAAMQDHRSQRNTSQRVHAAHVKRFVASYADERRLEEDLLRIIGDDTMFREESAIADAYSLSWAMTFYFAEREPGRFATLVQQSGKQLPFRAYPRDQRRQDFERWAAVDVAEFAQQLKSFVQGL